MKGNTIMCNYPEESNYAAARDCHRVDVKCENPSDTKSSNTESLRIVERKPSHDPNFDKIEFNRELTFAELKQMCSKDGMQIQDDTTPTLTKETIEQATDAFMAEAEQNEVNETSNTEPIVDDAPEYLSDLDETPCEDNALDVDMNEADADESEPTYDRVTTAAEEHKDQYEKLVAKLEGKTGDDKADREKAIHAAWAKVAEKWDSWPIEIRETLDKIPWFALSRNMEKDEVSRQKMEQMANYDQEQMVKSMTEANAAGKISVADAAKTLNEPTMINEFMLGNSPDAEKLKNERFDFSASNFCSAKSRFVSLQEQGVIPPTNKGESYHKLMDSRDNDGDGTLISGAMPSMSDVVKDGNGFGRDCRVADIFDREYANYRRVNAENPINIQSPKIVTPDESLNELMSDLPKSMVDKILSIPSDDWRYGFDGDNFDMTYAVASRTISLTLIKKNLLDNLDTNPNRVVFKIAYSNNGPGSVEYRRLFQRLEDIGASGKNANRLYQWFGRVMAKFFNK